MLSPMWDIYISPSNAQGTWWQDCKSWSRKEFFEKLSSRCDIATAIMNT